MKTFCVLSLLFSTFLISNAQLLESITPALGGGEPPKQIFDGVISVYNFAQEGILQMIWTLGCPDVKGTTNHPKAEQACKELEQLRGNLDSLATSSQPEVNAPGCPETDIREFAALSINGKYNGQEVKVMEVKYRNRCSLQVALAQANLPDLVPFEQDGNLSPPIDAAPATTV
ncbi:hypothetical protein BDA99DRAFT_558858 [Phascolomyces articulosus]|uniref:Secreted protein n=1 Tax=Phascolomyces articulosus TaxID=60185 RepID=A0AAD5KCE3_9FUNG|nr:hypothetical protein BDA99DRAFT_558858 [Phascolomyces articulosus]